VVEHQRKKPTYALTAGYGGFGAQYSRFIAGVAVCERNRYEYIHRPLTKIQHGESVDELNRFIGFPRPPARVKADMLTKNVRRPYRYPDIFFTQRVLDKIRDYYYSTPKPAACEYDIAIHIRRGDVGPWRYRASYTGNRVYKKIIKRLNADFPNSSIGVYSEGEFSDFKALAADNVHFCLNGDLEKTFHDMVTAKVLVASKSNLSYIAAILSVNTIYYIPFWMKPRAHWRVIEEHPLIIRRALAVARRRKSLKTIARKLTPRGFWYY